MNEESLIQALSVLQQATALEYSGDVNESIEMYSVAASRLDAAALSLPEELALTVRRNAEELKRKVELLRRSRNSKAQFSNFPAFSIQFVPAPMPIQDYRVPRDAVLRVFWLMRALSQSIQRGAFLTPGLYVPKEVWHQDGAAASLRSLGAKVKYLSALCELMEPLHAVKTLGHFAQTQQTLTVFTDGEKELRRSLDHYMGRTADATVGKKSIWDVFSRKAKQWRQQDGNLGLTLTWACNALEQAQLLERWYIYFSHALLIPGNPSEPHMAPIVDMIKHLSIQFYTGPCFFLLQDMSKLMERYQSKSCASVTRLVPPGIKIEVGGPKE